MDLVTVVSRVCGSIVKGASASSTPVWPLVFSTAVSTTFVDDTVASVGSAVTSIGMVA